MRVQFHTALPQLVLATTAQDVRAVTHWLMTKYGTVAILIVFCVKAITTSNVVVDHTATTVATLTDVTLAVPSVQTTIIWDRERQECVTRVYPRMVIPRRATVLVCIGTLFYDI